MLTSSMFPCPELCRRQGSPGFDAGDSLARSGTSGLALGPSNVPPMPAAFGPDWSQYRQPGRALRARNLAKRPSRPLPRQSGVPHDFGTTAAPSNARRRAQVTTLRRSRHAETPGRERCPARRSDGRALHPVFCVGFSGRDGSSTSEEGVGLGDDADQNRHGAAGAAGSSGERRARAPLTAPRCRSVGVL